MDLDGNRIKLSNTPNSHILVLGTSGYGKTYFCVRKMEEICEDGQSVYVLDISGSYTKEELEKNGFKHWSDTQFFDINSAPFFWISHCNNKENLAEDLGESLSRILKIQSYKQANIIRETLLKQIQDSGAWNVTKMFKALEMQGLEASKEEVDVYESLLQRFAPFKNLENFTIKSGEYTARHGRAKTIKIIQLSHLPDKIRGFLAELIAEIMWKDITHQGGIKKTVDCLLIDEFQKMSTSPDDAISCMLREGRKYGLSLILSSQFIGGYAHTKTETLLQSANILFFKPTIHEQKMIAKTINFEERNEWHNILRNLKVGEAVLLGSYLINNRKNILRRPIICKI